MAAISLCFGAGAAYAQQVTISGGGIGCQNYETFEKIFAFANAKKYDLGDKFIAMQAIKGECTKLKSAILIKRGFYFSKVMDADGREWYVIAQSVQD